MLDYATLKMIWWLLVGVLLVQPRHAPDKYG